MHKQINQLRADLMAQFPERKDVIDGSLAAVLAGEHVLLIGPPGTAKSALVRCIAQLFGGSYFERLLTKFSTPEELLARSASRGWRRTASSGSPPASCPRPSSRSSTRSSSPTARC
jgi:MoxR-like ATPase